MPSPATLLRAISPPPTTRSPKLQSKKQCDRPTDPSEVDNPSIAAVEAGRVQIENHLSYFRERLAPVCRRDEGNANVTPRLSMDDWAHLYLRNRNARGRHFVVHQHQHPVAGVHYDLRLQFSETSSISFAIPYGLPGNPNSRRPTRMAIETRVHTLWSHLTESASHTTGSLLIWDTGEYEILPSSKDDNSSAQTLLETDDESPNLRSPKSHIPATSTSSFTNSEPQKLISAFQSRSIHLRLHGTRLPKNYTIHLHLPAQNATSHRLAPTNPLATNATTRIRRRRRRRTLSTRRKPSNATPSQTSTDDSDPDPAPDSESEPESNPDPTSEQESNTSAPAPLNSTGTASDGEANLSSDDEAERALIAATNAYPGATNSIGSVHQRQWFLTLDRRRSGFVRRHGVWVRGDGDGNVGGSTDGFDPFVVWGSDRETSVLTGRNAKDVLDDEGVQGFVERDRWRPVVE